MRHTGTKKGFSGSGHCGKYAQGDYSRAVQKWTLQPSYLLGASWSCASSSPGLWGPHLSRLKTARTASHPPSSSGAQSANSCTHRPTTGAFSKQRPQEHVGSASPQHSGYSSPPASNPPFSSHTPVHDHCQSPPQPQAPSQACSTASSTRRGMLLAATAMAATTAAGPLVLTSPSSAAALSGRPSSVMGFEPRVVEFTLRNGLHFIVLPRRNAPVVACHTYANVGAWNEEPGFTGMAHLLEHMAFKGTPRVGSVDFRREAPLLDLLDEAFYELREAKAAVASGAPGGAGPTRVSTLRARLRSLQEAAASLAVPNAFGATLQRAGGAGLNATTSHDQTRYFVSLPSNKLELWMSLEAERFRAPVFRELYSEKSVIEEERRLRVDNSPMGRYQQEFALTALANNYRRPVIGFEEDFDAIGRREVQAFFDRYYGPANLTIAVVGDADPRVVRRMAERYWGDWQGAPGYQVLPRGSQQATAAGVMATPAGTRAPLVGPWGAPGEQDPRPESFLSGSRTSLRAPARSGPAVLLGYYRPSLNCREGVALEVLADVLSGGRTSRLVSQLVLSGKALSASVVSAYPGELHAGLSLVYGVPREGEGPEAVADLLQQQLAGLVEDRVTDSELARVQRAVRAGLLASAQSNSAMASALASYHVSTGSWRGLVEELDQVTQLKTEELRDVAERLFAPGNCFTGYVLKA